MKDSRKIILRLFANIVRVNKSDKAGIKSRTPTSVLFFLPWLNLHHKLKRVMTYLIFGTQNKSLVRLFQNWASFYVRSLEITALCVDNFEKLTEGKSCEL